MKRIQGKHRALDVQRPDQLLHQVDLTAFVILQLADLANQVATLAKKRDQRGKGLFAVDRLGDRTGNTFAIHGHRFAVGVLAHPAIELFTHLPAIDLMAQPLNGAERGRFIARQRDIPG